MNTVLLNTVSLDGAPIIKKGSGGGVTINNQSKSVEITENGSVSVTPDAGFTGLSKVDVNVDVPTQEIINQDKAVDIVENGTTEIVADAGYTGLGKVSVNVNVASSGGGSGWTGHADAEGLRAIGWTDEDIAYYQENGVNWNEEDDEYHKVSEDNKALYGVMTASNILTYRDRIVYLPKIDTSKVTSMSNMFDQCSSLVAIPLIDTSKVTNMSFMFVNCKSLISIPLLDTSSATNMGSMFNGCTSLISIPQLDTSNVAYMDYMFYQCSSLVAIPLIDTSKVQDMNSMFNGCLSLISIPQLNISRFANMNNMFNNCYSLISIPQLNTSIINMNNQFKNCKSLTHANLKGVAIACGLNNSALLSKESLLYLINNEAATSAITITLASYAYERLANDADVVAALANHPNISIAQ